MGLFNFEDEKDLLGVVREVDTRKVSIYVSSDSDLRKAKVGHLVCLESDSSVEIWLIGIVEKAIKSISFSSSLSIEEQECEKTELLEGSSEEVINTVKLTLIGTTQYDANKSSQTFSRSLTMVPDIEAKCYILKNENLVNFMNILMKSADTEKSLALGQYTIDDSATAYLDGDKLFQRHAALLGSTGSGKSWTVASILEKAAELPSSNLIVFDLHGEYKNLSYAHQLRIPGPDRLGEESEELLYLPYWLLNAIEMQSMFIDNSEFSAHNQVTKFQDLVLSGQEAFLQQNSKTNMLKSFTLDSPIPYEIKEVLSEFKRLDEEMVQGKTTPKQGKYHGTFSRLIVRLRSKLNDRRYGFLFKAPKSKHTYETMAELAKKLMDFKGDKRQIKVIDFSEVPSDILPVILGLVARIVFQTQFWFDPDKRHPISLVCDEAHLYLPKKDGKNPVEKRAIESFEKIAKEGRKYGIALFVVSQRPSDVSSTILSQCNNFISLRLTNSDDQNTVKKLLPDSLESIVDILPIMDIGEALVVGDAVLLPNRIRITPPNEKPDSATIDFWSEWAKDIESPDYTQVIENMRRQGREKGEING